VQGAPKFTTRIPAPSPGVVPDHLSLSPVDWFKCEREDRKVGDTPKLTKCGILSDDGEKSQFPAGHFFTPGSVCLSNYRRLFDAVSWLGRGRAQSIASTWAIAELGANGADRFSML
jgi:hypothetical protein